MIFKRLMAFSIGVAMIVGMTPFIVVADETGNEPSATETTESSEPEEEAKDGTPDQSASEDKSDKKVVKPVIVASGSCGSGVTWQLDEKGTMTITKTGKGNGAMDDWTLKEGNRVPWTDKKADITKVVIKKGVTTIGNFSFQRCKNLKSVTIPAGVKKIGDSAFMGCINLEGVKIPSSVKSIGSVAFALCNSFTSITIPSSVTSIGYDAFQQCENIKSVKIPGSVAVVGGFAMCNKLETVTIGYGATTIADSAFYGCPRLEKVSIPYGVTSIGEGAFQECKSLMQITIPSSVTTIGTKAFKDSSLTSISITNELFATCDSSVFENCGIPSVAFEVISLMPNPMTVKGKTAKVKKKKVKKKNQTVAVSKVFKFTKGVSPYLFVKLSGNKKITINKTTGKVTVKKKLKKGTYKIKVKVMSRGDRYYRASDWQTVTFKIKVK